MEIKDGTYLAGAGTTGMSITALALAGLDILRNGGAGLLGGGNQLAEAQAKIAKLEAERYTDEKVTPLDEQAVKNSAEIAAFKKEMHMQAELDRKQAEIDILKATTPLKEALVAQGVEIANLKNVVGKITTYGVPNSAIIGGSAATAGAGA
jgi:hypothetical protein